MGKKLIPFHVEYSVMETRFGRVYAETAQEAKALVAANLHAQADHVIESRAVLVTSVELDD